MADIKVVAVRLKAYTDDFRKAMTEGASSVDAFGKVAVVGFAAAGAAMLAFGKKSADTFVTVGREVMKLSRLTGDSAEEMSKFRFAAQQSGVSTETLATGIKFLQKSMAAGKAEFSQLGVAVKDSDGNLRSAHAVFLDTAEALSKMSNAAERNDTVLKLFGRSGLDLLPILAKGKQGILELEEAAQKYGLVLTKDNLAAVSANLKAHRQFDAAMQGLQVQIGQHVLPVLTQATDVFAKLVPVVTSNIAPITMVGAGLVGVTVVIPKVVSGYQALTAASAAQKAAMGGAAAGVLGLVAAYEIWNTRMEQAQRNADNLNQRLSAKTANDGYDQAKAHQKQLMDQINSMNAEIDSTHAPWDQDYREEMIKGRDATIEVYNASVRLTSQTDALSSATGRSKEEVTAWLHGMERSGVVFDSADEALTAFNEHLGDQAIQGSAAADQIMRVNRETQRLIDAERAMLNPQFAMIDALGKLHEAQVKDAESKEAITAAEKAYHDAGVQYGWGSQQAAAALRDLTAAKDEALGSTMDLAKANMDLDAAVAELQQGLANGTVSIEDTRKLLETWEAQGRLTKEQVAGINWQLGVAKAASDQLNGTSIVIKLAVQGLQAAEDLGALAGSLAGMGAVSPHAAGGALDEGWNLLGEQGPELAYKQGSKVSVATAAQTRGMLTPVGSGGGSGGGGQRSGGVVIHQSFSGLPADEALALAEYRQRWALSTLPG